MKIYCGATHSQPKANAIQMSFTIRDGPLGGNGVAFNHLPASERLGLIARACDETCRQTCDATDAASEENGTVPSEDAAVETRQAGEGAFGGDPNGPAKRYIAEMQRRFPGQTQFTATPGYEHLLAGNTGSDPQAVTPVHAEQTRANIAKLKRASNREHIPNNGGLAGNPPSRALDGYATDLDRFEADAAETCGF